MHDKSCSLLANQSCHAISGQTCGIAWKDSIPFVTGHKPVANGDAYDPVIEMFNRGLTLKCTPEVDAAGRVRIKYVAEDSDVKLDPEEYSFTRSVRFDEKLMDRKNQTFVVQTPETHVTRIKGAVTLPVGRSVAIDGLRRQAGANRTAIVLLLTVAGVVEPPVIAPPKEPAKQPIPPGK
jgi:type II secretory pathway component GspD/PulD (secretin)